MANKIIPSTESHVTQRKVALTDAKLRKLKARPQAYELGDAGCPGLRVRVLPSGKVNYRWVYRDENKKQRVKVLGEYPDLPLADARKILSREKAIRKEALKHGDPLAGTDVETVQQLAELFRDRRLSQRKRSDLAWDILRKDVLVCLGPRKLKTLTAPVVGKVIATKAETAPNKAVTVLALVKQMLSFGEAQGFIRYNVASSLRPEDLGAQAYTPGNRYLTAEEIRKFYQLLDAATYTGPQVKIGLKILLLTGVRSGELMGADWEHIDLEKGEWVLPVSAQKLSTKQARTAKDFTVPLSPQVVALFRELKEYAEDSPHVMPGRKGRLATNSMYNALRYMRRYSDLEPFSPHDLRRTCRTHLTDTLDIQPHVAEKVLNHSLGALERIYDKGSLLRQRREALERWVDWVDRVVSDGGKIAELRT